MRNADYRRLFAGAFNSRQAITGDQLGKALAAFQRSLTANNAPFDRYMRGATDAMTDAQVRGCSGSRASAASTATADRCSRITSCTSSASRTTRGCLGL